ncbi:MAG: polysaccharide biosynthesis/export family protein [Nannocystaceae bacterium]
MAVLWIAALLAIGCGPRREHFGSFRYERTLRGDDVDVKEIDVLDVEATFEEAQPEIARAFAPRVPSHPISMVRDGPPDAYRLGAGDVLSIYFVDHPELSSQRFGAGGLTGTAVRQDGAMQLPTLGEIPARGKTLSELRDELIVIADKFVYDPRISIEIIRYASKFCYVLGEVRNPGVFTIDGNTTLLETFSRAGGALKTGDIESAIVVRGGDVIPLDVASIVTRGRSDLDVYVSHGDLLFIPNNLDHRVFVLGEVKTPTAVPMINGHLSLAAALAAANGPLPSRARRYVYVLRDSVIKPQVLVLDLEKALVVDSRIRLRPGDRVIVAPTGLSNANRYMTQFLPFLLGAQATTSLPGAR